MSTIALSAPVALSPERASGSARMRKWKISATKKDPSQKQKIGWVYASRFTPRSGGVSLLKVGHRTTPFTSRYRSKVYAHYERREFAAKRLPYLEVLELEDLILRELEPYGVDLGTDFPGGSEFAVWDPLVLDIVKKHLGEDWRAPE